VGIGKNQYKQTYNFRSGTYSRPLSIIWHLDDCYFFSFSSFSSSSSSASVIAYFPLVLFGARTSQSIVHRRHIIHPVIALLTSPSYSFPPTPTDITSLLCVDDVATAVVNPHFNDFLREANKGRTMEEERAEKEHKARGDARELGSSCFDGDSNGSNNGGNNDSGGSDEDNGGDSDGGGHRQQSTKRGSGRDDSCGDGRRWTTKARKIGWRTTMGKGRRWQETPETAEWQ
jgi:hypothetical protein